MKIVIQESLGRMGQGLASSVVWIPQCEVITWNPAEKPVMDMFDEVKPDIVISSSEVFSDKATEFAKKAYPNAIMICVGHIEDYLVEPNFCIGQHQHRNLPILAFGDGPMLGKIGNPSVEECLRSDVVCITSNVRELTELDNQIIQYLSSMSSITFKAFGTNKIPVKNYLGIVDHQTEANAINSSKIILDLDGGSGYDGLWLKKNVITTKEIDFSTRVNNALECKKALDEILSEEENPALITLVQTRTYFDLTCDMFRFIGLEDYANFILGKKGELI